MVKTFFSRIQLVFRYGKCQTGAVAEIGGVEMSEMHELSIREAKRTAFQTERYYEK